MRKMYVDADEVSKDWGVSKPKAYKMIKELNEILFSMTSPPPQATTLIYYQGEMILSSLF